LFEPAKQVNQCNFGALVASPMEWGGATLIFSAKMHALLLEEEQTNWLVTLCGNMHHVKPILVL